MSKLGLTLSDQRFNAIAGFASAGTGSAFKSSITQVSTNLGSARSNTNPPN